MTKLNTMQDYNNETAKRATALLSSGDEVKIESYFEELAVVGKYIHDNYQNIADVVKDFELWSEMTKDVLNRSTSLMGLIFTPEEIVSVVAMCDDIPTMRSYWEEVMKDFNDTTTSEEILEPFDAVINH